MTEQGLVGTWHFVENRRSRRTSVALSSELLSELEEMLLRCTPNGTGRRFSLHGRWHGRGGSVAADRPATV
jgi:hypothetical protein